MSSGVASLLAQEPNGLPRTRWRFGGGYTDLAIVADTHPAHHIMQAWRYFSSSSLRALLTNARINAHTTAQPKLYVV